MKFFQDDHDGYYEFPDDAPETWYAHLTPCDQIIPVLTNAEKIEALKAQLDTMEREAIMPRGAREAFIILCKQQGAAAGLNETQLYAANPFFKGLKDTDNIAAILRAQITALK